MATLVERRTRNTVLLRNNDRKSLEFVGWRELETGMGTKAWFCDSQAPWQKGTVENMNKRIRLLLPGTPLC